MPSDLLLGVGCERVEGAVKSEVRPVVGLVSCLSQADELHLIL